MNRYIRMVILLALSFGWAACDREEFLDKIPDKSLLIPGKLADFRALLDWNDGMNLTVHLTEIASDDIYSNDPSLYGQWKNSYIWAQDMYEAEAGYDWDAMYKQVLVCNVILESMAKVERTESNRLEYDAVKGSALFFRGHAFYNLAQMFAPPYDRQNAGSLAGIPLKLTANVNTLADRGTLEDTYRQITADLNEAAALLPEAVAYKTRPGRAAALGTLARVYLSMELYAEAGQYAGEALKIQSALIDYNTLNVQATFPFPQSLPYGNDEVIFYSVALGDGVLRSITSTGADTLLYKTYETNDLRKSLFFNKVSNDLYVFKGRYSGGYAVLTGITTDELYLIRAECAARSNRVTEAMADLNFLLSKRWKTGTYTNRTAADGEAALRQILTERRKELVYRNVRWSDLRRLNKDPRFALTLKRRYGGQEYTLPPGDVRYVFPIPEGEIAVSGIKQNPR